MGLKGGCCDGSGLLGGCLGGVGLVGIGSSTSSSSCNAARRLSNCKRFSLDSIFSSPSGFEFFILSYSSNMRAVMMFVTDGLGVPTELAVTVESTWDTTPGKGLYVVIVGGVDVVEVSRFGGLYKQTSAHEHEIVCI